MSDISVIGLGKMGAALARCLLRSGLDVTVWNRSLEKTVPLTDLGAEAAENLSKAVAASPILLICISNHDATKVLLEQAGVDLLLSGRVVVQCSSDTPKEAEEAATWMRGRGATYLNGAILAGPDDIGTKDATILFSGDPVAFEASAAALTALGEETVHYLGENVRQASALDLAWLMLIYGKYFSGIHAANICRSEDVALDRLIDLIPDDPWSQGYLEVIRDESFDHHTASLGVWGDALAHIRTQGVDAGINTEIPDFFASFFQKAIDAGYADSHVLALSRVLQKSK